jgi:hypothetical protein
VVVKLIGRFDYYDERRRSPKLFAFDRM